jgi:methylation protein EvaC
MAIKKCKSCKNPINPFINFGKMPIANAFYNKKDFNKQYYFDMKAAFCKKCFCFQLINIPNRKLMFHENYAYFASTSKFMQIHWQKLAYKIIKKFKNNKNHTIIEIGSNDGIFLKNFSKSKKWTAIGVEPSKNVAKFSKSQGLKHIINDFFNYELTKKIILKFKTKADVVISTNTMHHIENTNSVFKGVKNILNEKGIFITEDPSLYEMIKKNTFDQIYAEHMYIWSAISLDLMSKKHGLYLYDLENNNVHGGCTRYYFCHIGQLKRTKRCIKFIQKEKKLGLNKAITYKKFRDNILEHSNNIYQLVSDLSNKGKKICGYTAPAKSTTLINFSRLNHNLIDKVFDNTKAKIGKYYPGKNKIPVVSSNNFRKEIYDYVILFAWNHKDEIFKKEREFTKKNHTKWIIPMPKIKIFK